MNKQIIQELDVITEEHNGLLTADAVVDYARNPETALHGQFEWDDTEAARQYRLDQARHIIRVCVTVIAQTESEVRAWVSLPSDRMQPGGGYRAINAVMLDAERRAELLEMARKDFEAWRRKYQTLKELAPVFAAMDATVEKKKPKRVAA